MATMVRCYANLGIEGCPVEIETTTMEGAPMLNIIGLGDQAVKEAGERIQAALDSCGYCFPKKKVVINLAPGDIKKSGSHFDLAMAIGVLEQESLIHAKELSRYALIGELSLGGELRVCKGILPMIIAAKKQGVTDVIVPTSNAKEAGLVQGVRIHGLPDLEQVIRFLEGKEVKERLSEERPENNSEETDLDFRDVRGQDDLVDAVVLAAAGGHNMLMLGEPGCGKTMIAQRIPTILPEMTEKESLEVTKIHSVSGLYRNQGQLIRKRPFRAPHHNISLNALIGGGTNALPGEVSLAHNGVLFLDELTEFSRRTLDALRQPLEDKKVCISRVNGNNVYPSGFMFVAAMNPCPCGYYPGKRCRCSDYEIIKYRGRISGPILDRIDIQKDVFPVDFFKLESAKPARSSAELRQKVTAARILQQERYRDEEGVSANAQMGTSLIQKYCALDRESTDLLRETSERYGYSARVIHKLLRLARTSADLDGVDKIRFLDMERVLSCRDFDKSNSSMMVVS